MAGSPARSESAPVRCRLGRIPSPVEPADVPDLRPGDRVAVAVSFDDGDKRGQGAILLPSVEVVRVLRGAASVGADDRIEAVQIRIPKDRLALVAGAVAGGRISMARLAPGDLAGIQPVPAAPRPASKPAPKPAPNPAPKPAGA